jgi:hypothetical protein
MIRSGRASRWPQRYLCYWEEGRGMDRGMTISLSRALFYGVLHLLVRLHRYIESRDEMSMHVLAWRGNVAIVAHAPRRCNHQLRSHFMCPVISYISPSLGNPV